MRWRGGCSAVETAPAAGYDLHMTKLLDEVIARVRALPVRDQDDIAVFLAEVVHNRESVPPLTDEQLEEVRRTQEAVRRGEVATDDEMDQLWRRFGLSPT